MGRIIGKVLLWILVLLMALLIATGGVLFWAFKHPRETWDFVHRRFLPADLSVTWEQMEFHGAPSLGTWTWGGRWTVRGLHVTKTLPLLDAPISDLNVEFVFAPFGASPELHFSEISTKTGTLKFRPEKTDEPSEPRSPFQRFEDVLLLVERFEKRVRIEKISVEIPSFELMSDESATPMVFSASLLKPAVPEIPQAMDVVVRGRSPGEKPLDFKAEVRLDPAAIRTGLPFASGKGDFSRANISGNLQFSTRAEGRNLLFELEGEGGLSSGKNRTQASLKATGTLASNEVRMRASASLSGLSKGLARIDGVDIGFAMPIDDDETWSSRPSTVTVTAPLALFFIDSNMRRPLEEECRCKIPEILRIEARSQVWLKAVVEEPTGRSQPAIDGSLKVESVDNRLFAVDAAASLKVQRSSEGWQYQPSVDAKVVIRSFQGLRRFLDAKNVMIPAPLDILDGTVEAIVKGAVPFDGETVRVPVHVRCDLKSEKQAAVFAVNAVVEASARRVAAEVKARVRNLQLELPPLDPLGGIPKFTRDRRILTAPSAKTARTGTFKVYFDVEAETEAPGAVRFLSTLAEPAVPLTFDLKQSSSKGTEGFAAVEPFTVTYLRRKVFVEGVRIDFDKGGEGDFPMSGRFRIDQTQYKVFVTLGGTMKSPQITLSSEPELPRSEIVSVLLFDRTSSQLVAADAETVGGVEAALADRAIGLFGIWAFASTPIRSFSYNAVTKVYSATFVLGEGLTASIGTDWEQATQFELRKRISRRWMLTGTWVPPTADQDRSGRIMLQWERRF